MAAADFSSPMSHPISTQVQAAALSSIGRVRSSNQDAFAYRVEAGVFAVCDGMGGAAAGEVASHIAVESALKALAGIHTVSNPLSVLEDAVAAANHDVLAKAQRDAKLQGMGTTLVALVLAANHAWIANVGDSRCYRFRNRQLERLTKDHSLVDEQVRLGQLTQEEADASPFRNVITRAIGTQESVIPDVSEIPVSAGDLFLLCSDGLTREVSDEQIAQLLEASSDLEATCHALVEAANEAGGRDNITCLLARTS